ncbi:NAD(P) transhydrogenase subunit beta, partial [filamentous cyanobacterium CCP5]
MSNNLVTVAYIAATALFILSLGGLSYQETAKRGNVYGIIGMVVAMLAAASVSQGYGIQAGSIGIGVLVGILAASRVAMTSMPEMVALLNSFVGLAAVLIAFAEYLQPGTGYAGAEALIHRGEIYLGVFIGTVTFVGSLVAVGKLQEIIPSRAILLPVRPVLNLS